MSSRAAITDVPDSDLSALPADDEVEFYTTHGWYLSRRLFTDDEIDTLRRASEDFYAGHRDRALPGRPPRLARWTPQDGDVQRHNDYIHYESAAIGAVLRKPVVGAVAARLSRAREIRVFQSTLIYKPCDPDEPSNIVPWHYDRDYWATSTSDRMLTAFIPLHDCDESMGTITMIDGSHRWKRSPGADLTAEHFADKDNRRMETLLERTAAYNSAEIRQVPMVIPKGHVSFHHCRTFHGSGANRSRLPRRAISLHLQDGENAYREFRLADGGLATYNHDAVLRRTPQGTPDYADPEFCPVIWRDRGTPRD
jgi:hypothetical protein